MCDVVGNSARTAIECARLHGWQVPGDLDIADPSILKNMPEKDVRQINGPRDTERLIHLVPHWENFKVGRGVGAPRPRGPASTVCLPALFD